MDTYPIGLWSYNLGHAPRSAEDFVSIIQKKVVKAAADGLRLLVLPEYVSEACLAFKPAGLKPRDEMTFLAVLGQKILPRLAELATKFKISILAGTWPVLDGNQITNSAFLLTADGRQIRQDKLCLTPFEKQEDTWHLTPGDELKLFEIDGVKMAILICLDVEVPALSSLLAKHEIDLLLVPSMTEKLSGYYRVYGCAKARAVELMCAVAVCGAVGRSEGTTQNETNVSGAALFLPCEEELDYSGIGENISPTDGVDGEEPFLRADVPIGKIRGLRSGEAEVWPGAWTADHVSMITA